MNSSPQDPPFQDLLKEARNGTPAAIDALLMRVYPRVQRMVHRSMSQQMRPRRPWVSPLFSTGDVVQDVCLRALGDIESFRGDEEEAFVGYLATSVRHRLIDAIRFHEAVRRDRRRMGSFEDQSKLDMVPATPSGEAEANEEMAIFSDILESFQPRERALLRQRIEQTATFKELAEQLDYPSADAARKAFHALQARMALRLRARGLGEPDADSGEGARP